MMRYAWLSLILAAAMGSAPAEAQWIGAPYNLKMKTGGGRFFWADQMFFHEWHIQRNVVTGHCRLIDGRNVRFAWGAEDHCREKLEAIKREENLGPMTGKAVVALHGLLGGPSHMDDLSEHLRKQGYQVFNVAYSSTEQTVAENAADLDRVISSLEGIEEIDFVAHSLGNLVLRRYLADQTDATKGKSPDPRIKRIVMLAPPNNGAQLASRFAGSSVVQFCWGAAGREIADWDKLKVQLVVPSCEFGILAGGREVKHSDNPLIEGDDDFVVSVEETKLPGARDFQILPVWHHKMNENEKAFEYTTRFLATGCFIDQRSRHPLPRTEEAMRRDEVAK